MVLCLALGSLASPNKSLKIGFNDVMEIIGGVFVGMGLDVNAKDIEPCVLDTGVIGELLEQALADFLQKTYMGKVEAMAKLALAYKDLPEMMTSCIPASVESAKTIEKMVMAFAHPLNVLYKVGENLIVNGQDILADVSYAMGAYEFKQYYEFGFFCGQAAFKIIYVPEDKPDITGKAVSGIVNGLIKVSGLPPQTCLTESLAGGLFKKALSQDGSFAGTADGMKFLSQAVTFALKEAEECSGNLYTAAFVDELAALADPEMLATSKCFSMMNGRDISEFKTVKMNYMNRDWENVGFYIGKVIMSLTI